MSRSVCPQSHRIETVAGPLDLLPDGAVVEPATASLLLADVHLGKAEIFRRQGVPVPGGTSKQTLARLDASIERWNPRQVIILGDLIHGRLPADHELFDELAAWRRAHDELGVYLLRGNHDHQAGSLPLRCGIDVWPEAQRLQQFQLCHEPSQAVGEQMAICGHWHPVVRLSSASDSARLRCFWLQQSLLVLPAFGAFTGGHVIRPARADQVFLLDGSAVHRMPGRTGQTNGRR
ncbi:MAG: ligase-associated DNA damage response endonuclease PdeM [Burkholderiaceae bacterium]